MGQTTNKQFPYPDGTSNPNIPGDFQALAQAIDTNFNLDGLVGVALTNPVTANQILKFDGTNWVNSTGGTGTVTAVSVASANGFTGTVANSTSTPAITLTTSASGILKGSSGSLAAATSADVTSLIGTTTLGSTTLTLGGTTTTIAGLTLNTPTLTLSTTTSTTSGRIAWDATNDKILIGDGTATLAEFASSTLIQVAKTANYTPAVSDLSDKDKLIEFSSATGVTFTVPTNANNPYPIGTQINILQTNTGQVTVAGAAGVTVNGTPGLKLRAQWSSATLIKRATNTWVLVGDLSA